MPDELGDDAALYDVWEHFTAAEVGEYFDRVEALADAVERLRGAPPSGALVAEARDLRDHALHLGHLPIVAEVAGP